MTRLEQKVKNLQERFPLIRGIKIAADWLGHADSQAIHLGDAAEGGTIVDADCKKLIADDPTMEKFFKEGTPAADYYGEFRGGYPWIHPDLEEAVKEIGYRIEWWDPGTLVAYPD